MTTFFDFVPSSVAPFQFTPTLDGNQYNVIITWALYGQRYYANIYDLQQVLIVALPLVGSPGGVNLSSLTWSQGVVTAVAASPHGYPIAATVDLAISGAAPDAYNGTQRCFITDVDTFQYALADFPGLATVFGTAYYNINLVAGYFASSLVYRKANQQFEVSP